MKFIKVIKNIPEYGYRMIFLHKKIYFIFNIRERNFYILYICSLKVSDGAKTEFDKSTEWPPYSPDLNASHYNVCRKLK
jgi:hypothetical protein